MKRAAKNTKAKGKRAKKKTGAAAVMLGRIGASAAEKWAAQAFITANPSTKDEKGWDYLFQLPAESERPIGPLDLLPPEVACMVQVKTTTTADTSEPIALSNWQKMCSGPLPWFVLIVRIDAKNLEPVAAHLVHVDESWCAKALKRLREVGADAYEDLNDRTLNISWSPGEALAEMHGCELSRRIREVVPNQHDYFQRKIRWFSEVGYERNRARTVSVRMHASDSDELNRALAELAIGERRTFPSGWRASISDVRFGLRATLKEFGAETGEMEFRAPSQGRMRLTFESQTGKRRVEVDCDAFRARAVFPFLPERFDRVRLVGDDITAVLSSTVEGQLRKLTATLEFSIPGGLVPLARVRRVVTLGKILIENEQDPLKLTLTNGELTSQLHADGFAPVDPNHRQTIDVLDASLSVCMRFGVSDDILVDLAGFLEEAEWARFMAATSARRGPLVVPFDRAVPVGAMFGSVHEAALNLPDRILVQVIGAHGIVTACDPVAGRGARIAVDDGQLVEELHTLSRSRGEKALRKEVRRYSERVQAGLKALGCKYLLTPALYAKLI